MVLLITSLLLSSCTLFPGSSTTITPTPVSSNLDLISLTPTPSISTGNISSTPQNGTVVGLKTANGTIVIKLFDTTTPNTVDNFLTKINAGFYNGLTFHRVIADFMAQGGDPKGDGTGGGQIKSEINSNPFVRGSVGLARSPGNKEYSNDSQFFICFTTEGCQHLTNDYVNFGQVISGFDVLDKIVQNDKIISISQSTK